MTNALKTTRALLLASPLMLAACGEGYEMIKTDTMFPYGNQRTAGSGVAYVLAKMMPAKTQPILKPVAPRPAPAPLQETKEIIQDIPEPPPAPSKAEKIFREEQSK